MYAEIVSIGHELLMGEIVDTNSAFLAAQLPPLGIELRWVSTVGDDLAQLADVLSRARQRSQLILTTGGLGPTVDDLTREAIARALGEELSRDEELKRGLEERFHARGTPMPPHNLKQAALIPSATAVPNTQGTAPGWWIEKDGCLLVALPGPPNEMEPMWEHHVKPRLRERSHGTVILTRTLKTFGLSEATVDEMISPVSLSDNPYLGIYAKPEGIWLRLISRGATEEEAVASLQPVEEQLRSILGSAVWGMDEESLEERVGALLQRMGLTLACMESCSGGLLASTITEVPGASDYFRGGVVSYTNDVKIALGVPAEVLAQYGAVSPQTAEAMAQAIRRSLGADIGVGITGVAGPTELEGHPVGEVHIGLAYEGGAYVITDRYPARRSLVKRRAVMGALLDLWQLLQRL